MEPSFECQCYEDDFNKESESKSAQSELPPSDSKKHLPQIIKTEKPTSQEPEECNESEDDLIVNNEDFFLCDECGFVTCVEWVYQRHLKVDHEDEHLKEFTCDKCSFKAAYKGDLATHKLMEHGIEQPLYQQKEKIRKTVVVEELNPFEPVLDTVKKSTNRESTTSSSNIVFEKKIFYACSRCSFRSTESAKMQSHWKESSCSNFSDYQCYKCPFRSQRKIDLVNHMELQHPLPVKAAQFCHWSVGCNNINRRNRADIHPKPSSAKRLHWFKCGHCPFKSILENKVYQHIVDIHGEPDRKPTRKLKKIKL